MGGGPVYQPHSFSSSLRPLAFLGSPREEEGNFLPMVLLTTEKETSPAWGEGALQSTPMQVLLLQALWEPLSIPMLPGHSENTPPHPAKKQAPVMGDTGTSTSRILLRLEGCLWFPLPSPLSLLPTIPTCDFSLPQPLLRQKKKPSTMASNGVFF